MTLRGLLWRIFAWLPVCVAAWYWAAPFHAEAAGWVTQGILGVFEPNIVEHVERVGHQLSFVTRLESVTVEQQRGVLTIDVDALLYTFGVPLFASLMLASRATAAQLLLGLLVLLPIQGAGIALAFLVELAGAGANVASVTGIVGWRAEALVLTYQLASLVMPAAAPIVLWCVLRREFITRLERMPAASPSPALPGIIG